MIKKTVAKKTASTKKMAQMPMPNMGSQMMPMGGGYKPKSKAKKAMGGGYMPASKSKGAKC